MALTAQELQESMTVYYSLTTGVIRAIATGFSDMSIYCDMAEDMAKIQGYVNIPYNSDIFDNKNKYKVDIETKQVIKIVESETEVEINSIKEDNKLKDEKIQTLEGESTNLKEMIEKQNQAIAELSLLLVTIE